jgi:urease accessory protein
MGCGSTRITAADFVTPPELFGYHLAASGAGRVGGVRLELSERAGRTLLAACYQQVPLRLLPPFDFGPGRPALVYLLNPTAGLFDCDAQLVTIRAGPGSRAVVVGQSATRIHPAGAGFCTQQWHIQVEAGAVLVILPGPAIPFAGCRYYQHVEVDLAEGAGFVWGDVWLAGRYARGAASERFRFELLMQNLSVRRAGRLVYRDRFCWHGPWDEETAAWHFGGDAACGSLFCTGPTEAPGAAVLPTAHGDTCMRWHGASEAITSGVVAAALSTAARLARTREGPWLCGQPDLGPNHWFVLPGRQPAAGPLLADSPAHFPPPIRLNC